MTERDIFLAAIELSDPSARAAYLDRACAANPDLRAKVEGLLRSHAGAGSFLGTPLVAPADPAFAATRDFSGPRDDTDGGARPDEALAFLAPPGRPDSLGRIGHYEVLQVLGQGAFGIVFRAFDDVLQRVVAVKVLAPQMAATSPARKRFLREARTSAQVRHENVVQVYEVGEAPLPYLVMEFIPGETLQQRLDRTGPVDPAEVVRIGRQIAEALAAAHACDLIHRDIKPGNVLLEGGNQRVKITDFGLARAADDASISQSGIIAGTPMYMAPEQAKGEKIDHRADLFSLGSVLYQMLSGRPPFRASTTLAVLNRVVEDAPRPIREIIPEAPQWLCDIIVKLHAKDPNQRFPSAREVADLLAECETRLKAASDARGFPKVAPQALVEEPARPRPSRWKWAAAGALVVGAVVACAVALPMMLRDKPRGHVQAGPEPEPAPAPQHQPPAPPAGYTGVPPKAIRGPSNSIAYQYSPDGKWLVTRDYANQKTGAVRVWEVATGELRATFPDALSQDRGVAFSPDGKLVAYIERSGGRGHLVVLNTGTFDVVKKWECETEHTGALAFNRDGTVIGGGFGRGNDKSVILWNVNTGTVATRLNDFKQPEGIAFGPTENVLAVQDVLGGAHRNGRWEPDTRVLLYDTDPTSPKYKQRLHTWGAPDNGFWNTIHFTPDGARVLFCRGEQGLIRVAIYDTKTGAKVREIVPENSYTQITIGAISSDSKRLVLRHGPDGVHVSVWNLDTGERVSGFDLTGKAHRSFAVDPTFRTACIGFHTDPAPKFFDLATGKELVPGATADAALAPFSDADAKRIAAMPAVEQLEEVRRELKKRNPGYDGSFTHTIENDGVVALVLKTARVSDLSAVRALTRLRRLEAEGRLDAPGLFSDLSQLKGLALTELWVRHNRVSDLTPLKGMPLQWLWLDGNPVTDFAPLKDVPLKGLIIVGFPVQSLKGLGGLKIESLDCSATQLADLTPLKDMPLKGLTLHATPVSDLTPLKGMRLSDLNIERTKVSDLSPLTGMPLTDLNIVETEVTDLTPIKGLPLKTILLDFKPERDATILKGIKTLEFINRKPAADFWKELEKK